MTDLAEVPALLRRAAEAMRDDHPTVMRSPAACTMRAVADWLDVFASYPMDGGDEDDERAAAEAVARAYLGETP